MAIVKPEEMNFSNKNIVAIISGLPGTGKSTLGLSAPGVLLIDADEGMARVSPAHRRDSSICKTYEDILADVKAAEGTYKTIVVDTGGALVDMLKDWAVRTDPKASKSGGGISLQGFGIVKQEFLRLSGELRKKFNVIFIFHESLDKNGDDTFYSLVCEGSARTLVYQPADLAAHLFIQNGERYLGFTPTANYTAKSAYGIKGLVKVPELAEGDENNFLTKLFDRVRQNLDSESKTLAPQKEQYDEAMRKGRELVEAVTAPENITEALKAIDNIEHALTSKTEIKAMLKAKMAELKIIYDKTAKVYKYAE